VLIVHIVFLRHSSLLFNRRCRQPVLQTGKQLHAPVVDVDGAEAQRSVATKRELEPQCGADDIEHVEGVVVEEGE
ncbi:hypothetical protein PFISCL1PPCAC_3750, partial [Pristionchus fissidentatus]